MHWLTSTHQLKCVCSHAGDAYSGIRVGASIAALHASKKDAGLHADTDSLKNRSLFVRSFSADTSEVLGRLGTGPACIDVCRLRAFQGVSTDTSLRRPQNVLLTALLLRRETFFVHLFH